MSTYFFVVVEILTHNKNEVDKINLHLLRIRGLGISADMTWTWSPGHHRAAQTQTRQTTTHTHSHLGSTLDSSVNPTRLFWGNVSFQYLVYLFTFFRFYFTALSYSRFILCLHSHTVSAVVPFTAYGMHVNL